MSDTWMIIMAIWVAGFFIERKLEGIRAMLERFHEEAREDLQGDEA